MLVATGGLRPQRGQAPYFDKPTARPARRCVRNGRRFHNGDGKDRSTNVPNLGEFLIYWLKEAIKANLAPAMYVNYDISVHQDITSALGIRWLDRLTIRADQNVDQ